MILTVYYTAYLGNTNARELDDIVTFDALLRKSMFHWSMQEMG